MVSYMYNVHTTTADGTVFDYLPGVMHAHSALKTGNPSKDLRDGVVGPVHAGRNA
jgi:hypothetical protein